MISKKINLRLANTLSVSKPTITRYITKINLFFTERASKQKKKAEFAKLWKIDLNANKSVTLTSGKEKTLDKFCFSLSNKKVTHAENIEYLGDSAYVSNLVEQKWKNVGKSFLILCELGCKQKMASPGVL
ncbi:hypothetical protein BpHYR1_020283 [Brachionus plicatilis]|uniref:Uncharacterized protein n=1 Tax=Brachionus plicatilis TaxID=10195 RepID=A0A3M7PB62_BRAPC|nr:hypothetical protein BpHYR1_020283 [Brachionus plicatilis]